LGIVTDNDYAAQGKLTFSEHSQNGFYYMALKCYEGGAGKKPEKIPEHNEVEIAFSYRKGGYQHKYSEVNAVYL
jgi:hypothetical protein